MEVKKGLETKSLSYLGFPTKIQPKKVGKKPNGLNNAKWGSKALFNKRGKREFKKRRNMNHPLA